MSKYVLNISIQKMMFLLYKNGMRVVIHTANLIHVDWHQKTNGVWISELFPRIDPSASKAAATVANPKSTDSKTNFRAYLIMYLEHYGRSELKVWIDHLKAHNTSSAKYFIFFWRGNRFYKMSEKKIYIIFILKNLSCSSAILRRPSYSCFFSYLQLF